MNGQALCFEAQPRPSELHGVTPKISRFVLENTNNPDPVAAELQSMGKRGNEIAQARDSVLAILETSNACSAWFQRQEPDAAAMFRSLHIALDGQDPGYIHKTVVSATSWIYRQPYVARAQQNVGPGSTITINQRGAFFSDANSVVLDREEGGPAIQEPARILYVGNYRGGTQQARVLTLLHEFGHIIDLLPLDSGFPSGPDVSMNNSKLVMEHCLPELEASKKKLPRIPAAIAPALQTSLRD